MGDVLHAIAVFFEQLASVEFVPLLLAVGCHLLKTVCTSRAWRNTIAAAYPEEPVPWRTVYGAYIAAVGVNAVVPIRGGDAVHNASALRALLMGAPGPYRDAVLLNAAAALQVAGEVTNWQSGVEEAGEAIDKGLAKALLDCWIAAVQ